MFKRSLLLSIVVVASVFTVTANALQINLNFADDFKSNKDQLNFSIDLFHGAFPNVREEKLDIQALASDKTTAFAERLKLMYANVQSVSDPISGKPSQLSLGIVKNGIDISPATCQNINLNNKAKINILLSESACVIS